LDENIVPSHYSKIQNQGDAPTMNAKQVTEERKEELPKASSGTRYMGKAFSRFVFKVPSESGVAPV
jgi:hypothetical protein